MPDRPPAEAAFAESLKNLRTSLEMTQVELAEEMSARGFRWHPATVYKVENGERQIQLAEAIELARIFETDVEAMTEADADAATLRGHARDVASQRASALQSMSMLENLRKILARELARAANRLHPNELAALEIEANPPSRIVDALEVGRKGLSEWIDLQQAQQLATLRRKLGGDSRDPDA